jgi:hypothetical protein
MSAATMLTMMEVVVEELWDGFHQIILKFFLNYAEIFL